MSRRPGQPIRTAATLDRIAIWVGGGCAAAGAAGGFFVGFTYTLDQSDPALAPFSGALGLLVGALLGLLNAIVPVVVLAVVQARPWAAATAVRATLAGVSAAVPVGALTLGSGGSLPWLILCVVVLAAPAFVATLCLDWRTTVISRAKSARAAA